MKQRTIKATQDPASTPDFKGRVTVWMGRGDAAYENPPCVVIDVEETRDRYANIYLTPAESKLLRRALRKAERACQK